jgi:hypothetical protein
MKTTLLVVLLILSPSISAAADSRSDLSEALKKAKIGTNLRVDREDSRIEGSLEVIGAGNFTVLTYEANPMLVTIPEDSVGVMWKQGDYRELGGFVGMTAGWAIGYAIARSRSGDTLEEDVEDSVNDLGVALGGACVGGLFGYLWGRAYEKWDQIYSVD